MLAYDFLRINRPVTRNQHFIGRKTILKYIFENLNYEYSNSLALIGELGSGKTSLLNMIQFPETQQEYQLSPTAIMVKVDPLDQVKDSTEFYKYLGESLLQAIEFQQGMDPYLVEQIEEIIEPMFDIDSNFSIQRKFTKALKLLCKNEYKIVFILDDFDKTAVSTSIDHKDFVFLRSLAEDTLRMNVMYIITARKNVQFISKAANTSGFNNIFKSLIPFKPQFEMADAITYIDRSFAEIGPLSQSEIEHVMQLSGRIPELLRVTCGKIIDGAQKGNVFDDEALLDELVYENTNYLTRVVEKLEEELKVLLQVEDYLEYEYTHACDVLRNLGIIEMVEDQPVFTSKIVEAFVQQWIQQFKQVTTPVVTTHTVESVREGQQGLSANDMDMEKIMTLIFRSIHYGRETSREDVTKQLGSTLTGLNDKIESVESNILKDISQLNDRLVVGFEELNKQYLSPENEDIELYANKIKDHTINLINEEDLTASDESFSKLQTHWNELRQETKEFLLIGETLKKIFDHEKMDLAPISICYCRAFELELNHKLLPLLKSLVPQIRIKSGPRSIPLYDKRISSLMIGQFLFIINTRELEFKEAIESFISQKGIDMQQLIDKIDAIKDIRNRTAHAKKIEKHHLEQLRGCILGGQNSDSVLSMLYSI